MSPEQEAEIRNHAGWYAPDQPLPVTLRALEATRTELATAQAELRTLHIALAMATRAAEQRDPGRLHTINESIQPLVDAFMAWGSADRAEVERVRALAEGWRVEAAASRELARCEGWPGSADRREANVLESCAADVLRG